MPFSPIDDINFSLNGEKNEHVRNNLEYAWSRWQNKSRIRQQYDKLYNSHNGIIDRNEIDSIIKRTGKQSKVKYVKYRLGRNKLKQLHGEFLEIPTRPQVSTTNREAINKKMERYVSLLGLANAKPYIEKARELGYDIYSGMNIPDKESEGLFDINKFKTSNEIAMQEILLDKLKNEKLKIQFYHNFIDLTIVSEVFGVIERNNNGVDTFRHIPVKYALYEESVHDPFLERTPYIGEVRPMYYHEILSSPEFKLKEEQKRKLKEIKDSIGNEDSFGGYEMIDGQPAFFVSTIQWKGLEPVVIKSSMPKNGGVPYKKVIPIETYRDDKKRAEIERDVKNGKYEIEKRYRQVIWKAHRIAADIYTAAEKEDIIIQILNKNNKVTADYDYCGMLFTTLNGTRVPLQAVIHELERIYDDVRFQINKEIRKIKGNIIIYDDAFLPKGKKFIDIYHDIDEDGVMRYNSSEEGNQAGKEAKSNEVGIDFRVIGNGDVLQSLIGHAMDIERVLDRVTGMNDNRQGLTKATMTATANMNNIEASRSMTYDLFFFINVYIEKVLGKLIEKTKLNTNLYGEDGRIFIMSEETIKFLKVTKDIMLDNFGVSVTDGKHERDILQKVEMLFPQEINAGNLRTKDVIRFLVEENFSKALRILDKASEELLKIKQQEIEQNNKAAQNQSEMQYKLATEDREDRQEHEKELKIMDIEGKKEVKLLEIGGKGMQQPLPENKNVEQDIFE